MNAKRKVISLLATTAIADFSSATATTMYTVPTGYKCILSEAWVETAGDVGANLVATIGRSTALTDFMGNTTLSNLDADEDVVIMKPIAQATPAKKKTYAAGVIIQFKVAVAGNAVAGTVYLFGFLIAV